MLLSKRPSKLPCIMLDGERMQTMAVTYRSTIYMMVDHDIGKKSSKHNLNSHSGGGKKKRKEQPTKYQNKYHAHILVYVSSFTHLHINLHGHFM